MDADLQKKIEKLKEQKGADLSLEEDMSVGIMNLISLEEHFYFTYNKTKKDEYYEFIQTIRELRKKYLARMIPENEGETWCISKHLLASAMRLLEVGTKYQTNNEHEKAKEAFKDSYTILNIFWGLRLKLLEKKDLTQIKDSTNSDTPWKMEDIMSKLVDCCRE